MSLLGPLIIAACGGILTFATIAALLNRYKPQEASQVTKTEEKKIEAIKPEPRTPEFLTFYGNFLVALAKPDEWKPMEHFYGDWGIKHTSGATLVCRSRPGSGPNYEYVSTYSVGVAEFQDDLRAAEAAQVETLVEAMEADRKAKRVEAKRKAMAAAFPTPNRKNKA